MKLIPLLCAIAAVTVACKSRSADESASVSDSLSIAAGAAIYKQDCSACHTFDADAIGPRLGGIPASVTDEWLIKFISDPKKVIESGDERANQLYDRFKTMMPSFSHYDKVQLRQLISFLRTMEGVARAEAIDDPNALKDPIPERIAMSDLVAELKLVAQVPYSSEEKPRTRIVKMECQPQTGRLMVLDLRGKLYDITNGSPEVYFDIAAVRSDFIHKPGLATGFGSVAFHPAFAQNGLLYTTHTEPAGTRPADFHYNDSIPVTLQWVVTEWKTMAPNQKTFLGDGRELLRINMVTGIHGMQEAAFNPYAKNGDRDYGMLYIGIGDGGCVENKFPFLVRNRKDLWGSIIRIDPGGTNSVNGRYGIPDDNPVINGKTRSEIYAFGFRNPHHLTWLRSGQLLASNIGQRHIESYNLVKKGGDYGWPIREGTFLINETGNINFVYPLPPDDQRAGVTYPVLQYDHDEGNAITVGFEYTGRSVPLLTGKFFYGDIVNGRLFYSEVNELVQGRQANIREWSVSLDGKLTTMEQLCGDKRVDVRVGRDADGELYLFTKPDGKIYRIVNARARSSTVVARN